MAETYVNPSYVYVGLEVFVRACRYVEGVSKTTGLKCTVATACGDTCRIVNEKYGVDEWRSIWDVLVSPSSPTARR